MYSVVVISHNCMDRLILFTIFTYGLLCYYVLLFTIINLFIMFPIDMSVYLYNV